MNSIQPSTGLHKSPYLSRLTHVCLLDSSRDLNGERLTPSDMVLTGLELQCMDLGQADRQPLATRHSIDAHRLSGRPGEVVELDDLHQPGID